MSHFKPFLHQSVRCTAFLGLALAVAAQSQVLFTPPANLSNDGKAGNQQIAIDPSGNINVVWLDNTPGFTAVFFSRSSDGGATFSSPQNISNNQADLGGPPQIAVDSTGNIYVAWLGPGGTPDIFFTGSSDGGATFSAPMIISNQPSGGARGPSMAVDSGGNINVVWWGAFAPRILFLSRSSDGGATFSTPVSVSTSGGAFDGQVAVDSGGNINAVWCEGLTGNFQVTYSRSVDGGASFAAPKTISTFASDTCKPVMALDPAGNIYVAWDTQPFGDIYVSSSIDGGATFSVTDITNKTAIANSGGERITTDLNGNIYVVWVQNPSGDNHTYLFLSQSSDEGSAFSTPHNLSSNLGGADEAQIATGLDSSINIVWQDNASGNRQIFFTQSSDGGSTFSTPQNLSNDSGAGNPVIAMDPTSNVNVLWADNTSGSNSDVFFSRSEPPPTVTSLTLDPSSVLGGPLGSSTGTVTLSGPAPAGGAQVALFSSNLSAATVPGTVTVPAGATSATFTVNTSVVVISASVTISASYNTTTQSANLDILL